MSRCTVRVYRRRQRSNGSFLRLRPILRCSFALNRSGNLVNRTSDNRQSLSAALRGVSIGNASRYSGYPRYDPMNDKLCPRLTGSTKDQTVRHFNLLTSARIRSSRIVQSCYNFSFFLHKIGKQISVLSDFQLISRSVTLTVGIRCGSLESRSLSRM